MATVEEPTQMYFPSDGPWDTADGGISPRGGKSQSSDRIETTNPAPPHSPVSWPVGSVPPSPILNLPVTPLNHRPMKSKTTPHTQASTPAEMDAQDNNDIPVPYSKLITEAFGPGCDLYADVLGVSRDADRKLLRIAYFRRGRQVLSEDRGDMSGSRVTRNAGPATVNGAVSTTAKLKFQAVSMTYDILTNPDWRATYDQFGLPGPDEVVEEWDDDDFASTRSVVSASALRTSGSTRGKPHGGGPRKGGVSWNEEVEELVFAQDPGEIKGGSGTFDEGEESEESDGSRSGKKKKKKKNRAKKRVVVETEALQEHLAMLDKEAEKTFVSDLIDELEQSIEGMLSFGSMGTSKGGDEKREYFKDARKKLFEEPKQPLTIEEGLLFPDENLEPVTDPEPELLHEMIPSKKKRSKKKNKTVVTIERVKPESMPIKVRGKVKSTNPFDEEPLGNTQTNPFDEELPMDENPRASFDAGVTRDATATTNPFADEKVEQNQRLTNPFDKEYVDVIHPHAATTQSPPEAPTKVKRSKNTQVELVAPMELFVTKKTTRRDTDDDGVSAAYTVDDSVSTISESVVSASEKGSPRRSSLPRSELELEPVAETDGTLDTTCETVIHRMDDSLASNEKTVFFNRDNCDILEELGCEALFGGLRHSSTQSEGGERSVGGSATIPSDDNAGDAPEFHVYLMTYLKALSHDIYEWGHSVAKTDWLDALALSEGDLESMMGILRTEMALTPGDLPEDHLPAELKQTLSF